MINGFRVWDKERKEMLYKGFVMDTNGDVYWISDINDLFGIHNKLDDNYVVLPKTPFVDKDSKELWVI